MLAPSARFLLDATWRDLGATWCHPVPLGPPLDAPFGEPHDSDMAYAATEARLSRGAPATTQPISELRPTASTGLCHPSAAALQVLALDTRAALRHSVGTPIPIFHITRSLIRKHRLHAQRKKDDRLRRSRNTPFFAAQLSNPAGPDLESILRVRFAP